MVVTMCRRCHAQGVEAVPVVRCRGSENYSDNTESYLDNKKSYSDNSHKYSNNSETCSCPLCCWCQFAMAAVAWDVLYDVNTSIKGNNDNRKNDMYWYIYNESITLYRKNCLRYSYNTTKCQQWFYSSIKVLFLLLLLLQILLMTITITKMKQVKPAE